MEANSTSNTKLEITLDENAVVADIKKALMLIKGITSVKVKKRKDQSEINNTLARQINQARMEHEKGETILCASAEDMQRYFGSL